MSQSIVSTREDKRSTVLLHINNLINKYYLDDSSLLVVVIKTFGLLKIMVEKVNAKSSIFFENYI